MGYSMNEWLAQTGVYYLFMELPEYWFDVVIQKVAGLIGIVLHLRVASREHT